MTVTGAGHPANPLIVAVDTDDLAEAIAVARALDGVAGHIKVGHALFGAHGPVAVRELGKYAPVFLDLKLHDIPSVVARAARTYATLGVAMLTVHAGGGAAMVAAAVEGMAAGAPTASPAPMVLAVTVLTSLSDQDLSAMNVPPAAVEVPHLAAQAVAAGAPGVVCAPWDVRGVRAAVGSDSVVVTPGVRPSGTATDEHARAATPAEALAAGATHLVVGRPITGSPDPAAAARAILATLNWSR